jgi:protein ImuB
MERFLCVWSPNWAIERWRVRNPSDSPAEPFALVAAERGVRRLAAMDAAAARAGLVLGQNAADAGALAPELVLADADPAADARDLRALSDWAARFSPAVALDPPAGLFLDITGAAHLWGGEGALMADLAARLARAGHAARLACAATPGAAWALAHFGPDRSVCASGDEARVLGALPAAALRLEASASAQLGRLGVERVSDLAGLPRTALARRFGAGALLRLDQAFGRAREALVFRRPPAPWFARLAFAEPLSAPEDLARASRDVSEALCVQLELRGHGARRFDLAFHGVDGRPRRLSLSLSCAARDGPRIARLFAPRLESVDPGFGIEAVTLAAGEAEPLGPRQVDLEPRAGPPSLVDLAPLIDRLVDDLGQDAVWRAAPHPSHLPERACVRRPPMASAPPGMFEADTPRPLRLLRRPEPVEAVAPAPDDPPLLFRWRGVLRRVRLAEGPERIAAEWWRGPFEAAQAAPARDYYRVEDEAGARFWLFRAGAYGGATAPRWWLHGLF